MRFILHDRWGNPKGDVADVTDAVIKRSIGDDWSDTLDMTCASGIEKGDRLLLNDGEWREYVCTSPEETREQSFISTPHFVNSVQELQTARFIEEFHETKVTPQRALETVLAGTRWQIDRIATSTQTIELTMNRVTGYDALKQIADTLNLEIATRIEVNSTGVERRYVSLVTRVGQDTRQRFEFGAGLDSLRRTYSDQDVITRLYPYGATTNDKPLTITGITGKPYIDADPDTLSQWGLPDGKGGTLPAIGVIEHPDITTPEQLHDQAIKDLEQLSRPKVTYEASVATLRTAGIDTTKLNIGDLIQIVDTCFTPPLRLQARISEIKEDLLNEANSTITLGTIIETTSQRQTTLDRTATIVNQGKPAWDAATDTAANAHDTASNALAEAAGLTGKITQAQATAASAAATAKEAKTTADTASTAAAQAATLAGQAAKDATSALTQATAGMARLDLIGTVTDVTFTPDEFGDALSATRAVDGLPTAMIACPPPTRSQLDVWAACRPAVTDHDDDDTIPEGSIRVSVAVKPDGDLTVRIIALNTVSKETQ